MSNKFDQRWMYMYELVKNYYNYYGNSDIKMSFNSFDGVNYNEDGEKIGIWLSLQRTRYNNLSKDRKKLLEEVEFKSDLAEYKWLEMYNLAKEYYKKYHHLVIPVHFKSINGYEYNEEGKKLGTWLEKQRRRYDLLSDDRKRLLSLIKFEIKPRDTRWLELYQLAKNYWEKYNNIEIPSTFKTKNGYDYDKNGENLGRWIFFQREMFDKLPLDRKSLLMELGLHPNLRDYKWNQMYELATIYYKHYHNLKIAHSFKTKNGISYDEDGFELGKWITYHRINHDNLSDERISMLNAIGMLWSVSKEKEKITKYCFDNNIDLTFSYDQIKYMSFAVFYSKAEFLKSNNIPIIKDGIFHEIFSMSSVNMKMQYGFDLKELIEEYFYSLENEKGK